MLVDPMLGAAGSMRRSRTPPTPAQPAGRPAGRRRGVDLAPRADRCGARHPRSQGPLGRGRPTDPEGDARPVPTRGRGAHPGRRLRGGLAGRELLGVGRRRSQSDGRHGTGEIGRRMAPVSGFVPHGGPARPLRGWRLDLLPQGGGRAPRTPPGRHGRRYRGRPLLTGGPIVMTAEDVVSVCHTLPTTRVVAVHMEALDHCFLTRRELRETLRRKGLLDQAAVTNGRTQRRRDASRGWPPGERKTISYPEGMLRLGRRCGVRIRVGARSVAR